MIDIIIPAYNSHNTITQTLDSIAVQINKNDFIVTIVNDGGEGYSEIIQKYKNFYTIQEIGYDVNRGPGFARQYGLDYTNSEFFIFIDADDTFYNVDSVFAMSNVFDLAPETFMVLTQFLQHEENGMKKVADPNLVWVFGHMYRRSLLKKYRIKFTNTRANEDAGFNHLYFLLALKEDEDAGVKELPDVITYNWNWNPNSITRINNKEYQFGISNPGYVYNMHMAYKNARAQQVPMNKMAFPIMRTLMICYTYYNYSLKIIKDTQILEAMEHLTRAFFQDFYLQTFQNLPMQDFLNLRKEVDLNVKDRWEDYEQYITLEQFVELMLNKKDENFSYEVFEKNFRNKIK